MAEWTDYEINWRLAEIAGIIPCSLWGFVRRVYANELTGSERMKWSPLTDWSQLGPLMVKERISVIQSKQGSDSARAYYPDGKKGAEEVDTMRAIALAIIYKHEEE